jgi:hypothetical protein
MHEALSCFDEKAIQFFHFQRTQLPKLLPIQVEERRVNGRKPLTTETGNAKEPAGRRSGPEAV